MHGLYRAASNLYEMISTTRRQRSLCLILFCVIIVLIAFSQIWMISFRNDAAVSKSETNTGRNAALFRSPVERRTVVRNDTRDEQYGLELHEHLPDDTVRGDFDLDVEVKTSTSSDLRQYVIGEKRDDSGEQVIQSLQELETLRKNITELRRLSKVPKQSDIEHLPGSLKQNEADDSPDNLESNFGQSQKSQRSHDVFISDDKLNNSLKRLHVNDRELHKPALSNPSGRIEDDSYKIVFVPLTANPLSNNKETYKHRHNASQVLTDKFSDFNNKFLGDDSFGGIAPPLPTLPLRKDSNGDPLAVGQNEKVLHSSREHSVIPSSNIPNSPGVNVVAMSLYGSQARYTLGAIRNAENIRRNFPGWTLRIYAESPASAFLRYGVVPPDVIESLRRLGAEIQYIIPEQDFIPPMMWRFLVADDMSVDRFIVRDTDSRLTERDAACVAAWIHSGKPFSSVRDHPSHSGYAVSGGMWGGKTVELRDILRRSWFDLMRGMSAEYLRDMEFLNYEVWPRVAAHSYCCDSVSCDRWPNSYPFPIDRHGYEHVGGVYDEHDLGRPIDMRILRDAGENIHCLPNATMHTV